MKTQKEAVKQPDEARKSQIALKAFFNISNDWALKNEQQMVLLGKPSKATYFRWKKGEVNELSPDTLERISYLLGIYKALHILFSLPEQADNWIHRVNQASLFSGHSALYFMLHGKMINLMETRRYLDAQRG